MKYIPKEALEDLFKKYTAKGIFQIAQGANTSLILIVPRSQIEAIKNSPILHNLQTDLYDLIIQHTDDEISNPKDIKIFIESKEEFDARYQGSWYNYFR